MFKVLFPSRALAQTYQHYKRALLSSNTRKQSNLGAIEDTDNSGIVHVNVQLITLNLLHFGLM